MWAGSDLTLSREDGSCILAWLDDKSRIEIDTCHFKSNVDVIALVGVNAASIHSFEIL